MRNDLRLSEEVVWFEASCVVCSAYRTATLVHRYSVEVLPLWETIKVVDNFLISDFLALVVLTRINQARNTIHTISNRLCYPSIIILVARSINHAAQHGIV